MPKRRYALLLAFPLVFAMLPLAGLFAFSAGPGEGDVSATRTAVVTDSRDDALALGTDPCPRPYTGHLTDS